MQVFFLLLLNVLNCEYISGKIRADRMSSEYKLAMSIRKEIEDLNLPIVRNHDSAENISLTLLHVLRFALGNMSKIYFFLYTRKNINFPQKLITDEESVLRSSHFNKHQPVKIFIHGWLKISSYDFGLNIKDSYLKKYDLNVILVDWREIANSKSYPWVVVETKRIGKHIAKFLEFLVRSEVNLDNVHLIGHGIGAHIAGFASDNIAKFPARITGLDPAFPGFYLGLLGKSGGASCLNPKHADFVDVIHTNGGELGIMDADGFADFYPNGGKNQPGCGSVSLCSHERAAQYFEESISQSVFSAKLCTTQDFPPLQVLMGNSVSSVESGLFCLKTNSRSPFGRKKSEMRLSRNNKEQAVAMKSSSMANKLNGSCRLILIVSLFKLHCSKIVLLEVL